MFGSQVGPLSAVFSPVFSNGVLLKVVGGLAVPSASEGNLPRSVGINSGFGLQAVPPELRNGDWWGYLGTDTGIDGFGSYTLQLQPVVAASYNIAFQATYGTFAGQSYNGSFQVDVSGVTGVGSETLPNSTVRNFQLNMFGSHLGPLSGTFAPVFTNGRLVQVIGGLNVPSATEGNQLRAVGINNGFGVSDVPFELRNGNWWGYLDTFSFVDGFGSYAVSPVPVIRHYNITLHTTSGTFLGQAYSGSFDVDVSGMVGVGNETLPSATLTNFVLNMFGNKVGPLTGIAAPVFVDGQLVELIGGLLVPSATEANQLRSVGLNNGFGLNDVPVGLRNGPWFGYLDPYSFVDVFGSYAIEENFDLKIFTAVELEFATRIGRTYQIQSTTNIGVANPIWTNVGAPIAGTGASISQLLSMRGSSTLFFRAQETGQ